MGTNDQSITESLNAADLLEQEKLYRQQIDKIYDYTKFHIGIYGTLITAMIALQSFGVAGAEINTVIYVIVIFLFFISAMCGAIIASSILDMYRNYDFWKFKSPEKFFITPIGPFTGKWFLPSTWAIIEHISFWIGLAIAVFYSIIKALC